MSKHDYTTSHVSFSFPLLLRIFCGWGGMLPFFLDVVTHLQCLLQHRTSIQICPSGRRARSPLCMKVSATLSRFVLLSKHDYTSSHHTSLSLSLCCCGGGGVLPFTLDVATHLQRFMAHVPSIQICPRGRLARSPVCNAVSVTLSRCCCLFP